MGASARLEEAVIIQLLHAEDREVPALLQEALQLLFPEGSERAETKTCKEITRVQTKLLVFVIEQLRNVNAHTYATIVRLHCRSTKDFLEQTRMRIHLCKILDVLLYCVEGKHGDHPRRHWDAGALLTKALETGAVGPLEAKIACEECERISFKRGDRVQTVAWTSKTVIAAGSVGQVKALKFPTGARPIVVVRFDGMRQLCEVPMEDLEVEEVERIPALAAEIASEAVVLTASSRDWAGLYLFHGMREQRPILIKGGTLNTSRSLEVDGRRLSINGQDMDHSEAETDESMEFASYNQQGQLVWVASRKDKQARRMRILHANDTHAKVEPDLPRRGVARKGNACFEPAMWLLRSDLQPQEGDRVRAASEVAYSRGRAARVAQGSKGTLLKSGRRVAWDDLDEVTPRPVRRDQFEYDWDPVESWAAQFHGFKLRQEIVLESSVAANDPTMTPGACTNSFRDYFNGCSSDAFWWVVVGCLFIFWVTDSFLERRHSIRWPHLPRGPVSLLVCCLYWLFNIVASSSEEGEERKGREPPPLSGRRSQSSHPVKNSEARRCQGIAEQEARIESCQTGVNAGPQGASCVQKRRSDRGQDTALREERSRNGRRGRGADPQEERTRNESSRGSGKGPKDTAPCAVGSHDTDALGQKSSGSKEKSGGGETPSSPGERPLPQKQRQRRAHAKPAGDEVRPVSNPLPEVRGPVGPGTNTNLPKQTPAGSSEETLEPKRQSQEGLQLSEQQQNQSTKRKHKPLKEAQAPQKEQPLKVFTEPRLERWEEDTTTTTDPDGPQDTDGSVSAPAEEESRSGRPPAEGLLRAPAAGSAGMPGAQPPLMSKQIQGGCAPKPARHVPKTAAPALSPCPKTSGQRIAEKVPPPVPPRQAPSGNQIREGARGCQSSRSGPSMAEASWPRLPSNFPSQPLGPPPPPPPPPPPKRSAVGSTSQAPQVQTPAQPLVSPSYIGQPGEHLRWNESAARLRQLPPPPPKWPAASLSARAAAAAPLVNQLAVESDDEHDTICAICLDTCTLPAELPCGHSFCGSCLEAWKGRCQASAKQGTAPMASVECPKCRRTFSLSSTVGCQPPQRPNS